MKRIGSGNPQQIKHVQKFEIEEMFNRESIKKIRPSSAINFLKKKNKVIEEIIKGQEQEKNLIAIKKLKTFKIHQTLYKIKKEEEELNKVIISNEGKKKMLEENDVCMIVNSNNTEHIVKVNARKDQQSVSSQWIQQQKQDYLQSKIDRKILQDQMKSNQSQRRFNHTQYLQTQNNDHRPFTSFNLNNTYDLHNQQIEIFGSNIKIKTNKSIKSDRKNIKKNIESYLDKFNHTQTSHNLLNDTSKNTQQHIIIEEQEEDQQEIYQNNQHKQSNNNLIFTQNLKQKNSKKKFINIDNSGLNICGVQLFQTQIQSQQLQQNQTQIKQQINIIRPQSALIKKKVESSRPGSALLNN